MVKPNRRPTHPGIAFKELTFPELGMTQQEYADYIRISRVTLSNILNGKARITPEIAHKMGQSIGTSGALLLRMQGEYDLWELEQTASNIEPIISAA